MKLLFTALLSAAVLQPVEPSKNFLRRHDGPPKQSNAFHDFKDMMQGMEEQERLGGTNKTKEPAIALRNDTFQPFVGDPALATVSGAGTSDYFTKAWTGENAADPKRGSGGCTAWRKTLQCNPSGTRDPLKDKGCDEVITAAESGFCECGEYAQFAAVDCNHRPFTCESMCVKFAVLTGKQAFYRGRALSPAEAMVMFNHLMWGNQTDLQAMRIMTGEMIDFVNKAIQYTTASGRTANDSLDKYMAMMKRARQKDSDAAAAELAKYRQAMKDTPWLRIWQEGNKMIDAGRKIQSQVNKVLPFDPMNSPKLDRVK